MTYSIPESTTPSTSRDLGSWHSMRAESADLSDSDRPSDGHCEKCGAVTHSFLRPAFLGLPAKWYQAPSLCGRCLQEESAKGVVKMRQERIERFTRASRFPPDLSAYTFANFQISPKQARAFRVAADYELDSTGKGIIFCGPCGVGKTHLALAIANKFFGSRTVMFISCPEFLVTMRDFSNSRQVPDLLPIAKSAELLILDDIGAEKPSEWVREVLFVLIDHRQVYKLPTIFTTNCSMSEISQRLGDRIASRIAGMCLCVAVEGDDWRLKKKN